MDAGRQGFHDPELGYGDIAKISSYLLQLDHASFMLKLAQVLETLCTSYNSAEQDDNPQINVDAINLPEIVKEAFQGQDVWTSKRRTVGSVSDTSTFDTLW